MDLNGTVCIEYSVYGGESWCEIVSGLNDTGSYLWDTTEVPDGCNYRIRVSLIDEFGNTFFDVSDGAFIIQNPRIFPWEPRRYNMPVMIYE
jgi:hypothetical protein